MVTHICKQENIDVIINERQEKVYIYCPFLYLEYTKIQ